MEDKRLLRLIKRARFGDKDAFCEVIEQKSRKILFIATNLMGNSSDGEDAAQEAVITLAQKMGTLKKAELFDVWMYRIIFNVCMDEKRRKSRKPDESGDVDVAVATVSEQRAEVLPEQNALNNADKEAIMEALNELPERYRMCMILFYYEDMSYAEIAETMQVSEQVVANTLNRAKEKLRLNLGAEKADRFGFVPEQEMQEKGSVAYKAGAFVPALALTQAFAMSESAAATPSALAGLASVASEVAFPKGLVFTQFIESVAARVVGAVGGATVVASALMLSVPTPVPEEVVAPEPEPIPQEEPVLEPQNVVRSAEIAGLPEGAVTTILSQGYEDAELAEFKQNLSEYTYITSTASEGSVLTLYQSVYDENKYVLTIEPE
ncbi:MAG: RNA polymerase sigma factor [Raoultibacter sp.]|jgi:RNA polymerase sigma-70 factor (ECF subfamily)